MDASRRNSQSTDRNPQLDELIGHFARVVKVLAMLAAKEQNQEGKIAFLSGLGYTPTEIAELLGTTRNTVSVARSVMKKNRTSKSPAKNK